MVHLTDSIQATTYNNSWQSPLAHHGFTSGSITHLLDPNHSSTPHGVLAAVLPCGHRRDIDGPRLRPESFRQPEATSNNIFSNLGLIANDNGETHKKNKNKNKKRDKKSAGNTEENATKQLQKHLKKLSKKIRIAKLPDNILVNAAIRSTVYATLVHWLYTSRINSIAAGDAFPNLGRISSKGLVPCALKTGMEYAVAMGIENALNHLLPTPAPHQKPNLGLSMVKTTIAACPATALSLMTERFNQYLILGKTPQQALKATTQNLEAVRDALRGFPVATLGLAVMLTIQNNQKPRQPTTALERQQSFKNKAGKPPVAEAQIPPENGSRQVALRMAALGSVGGLMDYTIENAQLKGISSTQALQEIGRQSPATLAAYSLLGAVTLALFQTGIDQTRALLTQNIDPHQQTEKNNQHSAHQTVKKPTA